MGRILNLLLAVILLISCSGCFWDAEHDRGYHDERDRRGHDVDRHDEGGDHDNRGGHDEHR